MYFILTAEMIINLGGAVAKGKGIRKRNIIKSINK